MLQRNLSDNSPRASAWQELAEGAPTILGFAQLCSQAMLQTPHDSTIELLSPEAKTILVLAAPRGTIDIRAHRDSFDSADRFLAVCVEYALDQRLLFLNKDQPQQTIEFLEGFRQLCQYGLIVHHLQKDFSLSSHGYRVAQTLNRDEFQPWIEFATELDH